MKIWVKLNFVVDFNKMDDSITPERVTTTAPSGSWDTANMNVIGHSDVNIVNRGDRNRTHLGPDNRYNRGLIVNGGIANITIHGESSEILDGLRRAPAYYDSTLRKQAHECMQDTRVSILNTIYEWADSVDNPPIFWLFGQAGTGKSTIAHTVAKECRRRGRLGASFFFAHANAECSDPNLFFSTIAYQLSKFDPDLRQHIIDGVKSHPSPQDASIPTQFEEFILTPIRKLSNGPAREPIIVVVDAFDECSDARKASEILHLLSAKIPSLPLLLKLLITSRPEPEIRSILHPDIHPISRSFDLLRDIDASSTDQDIKLFLRFHLGRTGKEYDLPSWPREMDVEALAQQAGGLFIIAHTAIGVIRDKDIMDPESQLAMLKNIGINGTPAFNLNALYSRILQKAIPETAITIVQERVITVIHAIVGLRAPLALCAIERLLGLDHGAIRTGLNRLRSIFIVPDNDEDSVQVIHSSFARYITDEESCTEKRFFVDHWQMHSRLAKDCLEQMKTHLKQNICDFKDFTTVEAPIKDEGSLDADLQTLSAELKYSCENFAAHVFSADWQDGELYETVSEWANQYLPYWLEVLALIGSFRDALPSLRLLTEFFEMQTSSEAQSKFRQSNLWLLPNRPKALTVAPRQGPQLTESPQLLADTIRMVSESYDNMKRFPHLIYTCLAFSPSDSTLFKQYSRLSTVRIFSGKRKNWGPLLHAFSDRDSDVVSLTFSPDGTILASCSSVGRILLWNLETGESRLLACHSLRSHTAFTFSPDGKYIAADGNVYRVATGKVVLIPGICSSFSPDGQYIALGCDDGTIRLHDMQAPNLSSFRELLWDTGIVKTLAFSSDNKFLVSHLFPKNTICVWNRSSWEMMKHFPCYAWNGDITFSPNGTHVATRHAFIPENVWVVDIQTGNGKVIDQSNLFANFRRNMESKAFAFLSAQDRPAPKFPSTILSSNSRYIASFFGNAVNVDRWGGMAQELYTFRSPEFNSAIASISFTPDEENILVGNKQGRISSWRIPKDGRFAHSFDFECKAHSRAVQAITFSHNGKYFGSASIDGSICVWDSTSVSLHEPDLNHTSELDGKTVIFAPDGQTVTVGSASTISKMDPMTGRSIFHTKISPDEGNHGLIFSADGKYLAINRPQKLLFWETGSHCTLGNRKTPSGAEDLIVAHALSPCVTHYAIRFLNRDLWVYDMRSEESRQMDLTNKDAYFERLIFSPDSRHLVSYFGNICVFDVEKGVQTDPKLPVRECIFDCAFSPCGRYIAYTHYGGLAVFAYPENTPNVREVRRQFGYLYVGFSPDGKYILAPRGLSEERQLDLFHLDTLEMLYTVKMSGQYVDQPMREFRRTGRLLNHPLFQPSEYEDFPYLLDKDGWVITASSKRLCRLPVENRGEIYDVNGNRIVVVSPEGKVTLIQFGPNPVCVFTPL
ncbi:hypothetical protein JOM56_000203 [Amanita muscaria]